MAAAGWWHFHKRAPRLTYFSDNSEIMLSHHLIGLFGLGSLSWSGHQIHISLPINKLLDEGVPPAEIPLPHEFIINSKIMGNLYPSFREGLAPLFQLRWGEYQDFLTFRGGVNPVTGSLWLSDIAHHHVAIAVLSMILGHLVIQRNLTSEANRLFRGMSKCPSIIESTAIAT
jgi:photosystem I P700 chlorophyll a apoprotein A1